MLCSSSRCSLTTTAGLGRTLPFFDGELLRSAAPSRETALPSHWYYKNSRKKFETYGNPMIKNGFLCSVLYIGGFELPDKNAAAQRVIANARIFESLGYKVIFLNYSDEIDDPRLTEYFGFECFECPKKEWTVASRLDIDRINEILGQRSDISMVIAYNYPAFAQMRLKKLCSSKGVICLGDITEWYRARDVSIFKRPIKFVDTFLRMRLINKRLDGLILISSYLMSYYSGKVPCVLLPPLVDSEARKWRLTSSFRDGRTSLVYAGNPSKTKERLDLIVNAVHGASSSVPIFLDVIGITKEDYVGIYGTEPPACENITFFGRLPHEEVLKKVSGATYSIIVRDDNRVTKAGFPTKFAESITCGTPVICNDNSDLKIWVNKYKCGFVVEEDTLAGKLVEISKLSRPKVDKTLFDYRHYIEPVSVFLNQIAVSEEKYG